MKKLYTALFTFLTGFSINAQALPFIESFNYSNGNLIGNGNWIQQGSNSTDHIQILNNAIKFDQGGFDAQIPLTTINSGTTYYKFELKATDVSNVIAANGGFFAGFVESTSTSNYGATLWLIRDPGNTTKYTLGVQNTSTSASTTTPDLPATYDFNSNTTYTVVVSYTFNAGTNNDETKLWINPTTVADPPLITSTNNTADFTQIGAFMFRQDSSSETAFVEIDKLVIESSFANILSNNKFDAIEGLKIYPLPATNELNITSANATEKQIQLFDVLGKVALSVKVTNQPININHLAKGVYIAKITEGGKVATRKVVIE